MWRRNALIVVSFLFLGQLPVRAETPATCGSLVSRIKWMQFEILLGRFTAISDRMGQSRFVSGDQENSPVHEALSVSGDSQFVSLRYERTDRERQVTVEHDPQVMTQITCRPRGSSLAEPVQFIQPPRGKITLIVGAGATERKCSANSLWHLLLREPELCQQHLIPVLEILRPNWKLMEAAQRIEVALFESAEETKSSSREHVRQLVAELANPKFQKRQAADRELRSLGLSVLPILEQYKTRELTSEQRIRIKQIRASYDLQSGDTPDRVAAWLIEDRAIWATLLAHRESHKRQAAAQFLTGVCELPIGFDPLSDERVRSRQIDKLLEQFTSN